MMVRALKAVAITFFHPAQKLNPIKQFYWGKILKGDYRINPKRGTILKLN